MLFVISAFLFAGCTENAKDIQNPYVEAYLQEANISPSGQVIDSLNHYYQADLVLADQMEDYFPENVNTAMIYSVSKQDKIEAMHIMETIYASIEDHDCRERVVDYLRRYALDSGDLQAIAFYQRINS